MKARGERTGEPRQGGCRAVRADRPAGKQNTAAIMAAPNATSMAISSTIVATMVTTLDPGTSRRTMPTRSVSPTRTGRTALAPMEPTKAPSVVRNRTRAGSWA
jgi:hypothetical protein